MQEPIIRNTVELQESTRPEYKLTSTDMRKIFSMEMEGCEYV